MKSKGVRKKHIESILRFLFAMLEILSRYLGLLLLPKRTKGDNFANKNPHKILQFLKSCVCEIAERGGGVDECISYRVRNVISKLKNFRIFSK